MLPLQNIARHVATTLSNVDEHEGNSVVVEDACERADKLEELVGSLKGLVALPTDATERQLTKKLKELMK